MIQVRESIFETNSSSANVLCVPKDQTIRIPKRFIFMWDTTSLRPSEIVLCHMFDDWHGNANEFIDQIVNFLYLNGVEEIIYGGREHYHFEQAIETFKNNPRDLGLPKNWTRDFLLRALFGTETDCEYYEDGMYDSDKDTENNDYIEYCAD